MSNGLGGARLVKRRCSVSRGKATACRVRGGGDGGKSQKSKGDTEVN